jgi:Metallo-beta-lactamase superfamily
MRVTGTVQKEAWQRRELPPAEQVTGGVWSVPVPIPDNPVRYVLSYVIEHSSGVVLTDPGWNDPASWQALTGGLAACGVPLTAVTAVLVTHVHPDHHGLSGAVRERTGAGSPCTRGRTRCWPLPPSLVCAARGPPGTCGGAGLLSSTSGTSWGEVVAYLRHLRSQRIVTCADADGVGLWTASASA